MKRIYLAFAALLMSAMAFSQGTLTGTVTDGELGGPLPGASVMVKGTSTGTSTDFDGNFTLQVSQSSGTLVISYIGFLSKEVSFTSTGSIGTIALMPDAEQLGEMSADHISEAMETMGADLMGEGAVDFTEIESSTTFLDEAPVETPSALSDMMQAEGASSFFGSALFGQS